MIPLLLSLQLKVYARGDCWEFRGHQRSGKSYGRIGTKPGKTEYAHRLSFEIAKGSLGEMEVHHICSHGWCIRPSHLVPVTRAEHRVIEPPTWGKESL